MKKRKVGPCSAYMRLPDGTLVLWYTVENLGEPDQKVTYHVNQEQTEEWNDRMMANAGRYMSSFKRTDEEYEELYRNG